MWIARNCTSEVLPKVKLPATRRRCWRTTLDARAGDRVMYDTNKSAPKPPRCVNCARPMQLLRRTSRFALPDLCSFYCLACDEWHVEEREAAGDPRPHHRAGLTA